MKKLLVMFGVVALAASTTSCKKDYTCECTAAGVVLTTTTINDTKSNATSTCDQGDSNAFGITVDCSIK